MNRCSITADHGMLVLATPYDAGLIGQVKALPYAERKYDPIHKWWLVDPKHGRQLVNWVEIYFDEKVTLPHIAKTNQAPVTKLFEVRYIGACKPRSDGSSVAYGLIGSDWSVIFPEQVLRNWFDSGSSVGMNGAKQTLYQILGVAKSATPDELRTGYRRMAKQWHPDVCREPNAQETFIRIQDAYNLLSDTHQRTKYDVGLALQAAFEQQNKNPRLSRWSNLDANYRSPLRCGLIMLTGIEKLGRIEVTKILAWEDITKNGKTLVVSWPRGADKPVEIWS